MININRNEIINALIKKLEPLEYVYAMWLEGADANDFIDEYSDLDFYIDFEDEYEVQAIEAVENALLEISEIDFKHVFNHEHPKLRQRIYHLKGSNPYLMIDFCWQLHSRKAEDSTFIKGSRIENAKVLFDKNNIIKFKDYNPKDYEQRNKERLEECIYRYSQHVRVMKYVFRNQYLEAYAYYNRYVLEPLIDVLRLIYTPANADYYLIHISHHIPKQEYEKLEYFAKISSLNDISEKIPQAQKWFSELCEDRG